LPERLVFEKNRKTGSFFAMGFQMGERTNKNSSMMVCAEAWIREELMAKSFAEKRAK
jgi:hypothetical protein